MPTQEGEDSAGIAEIASAPSGNVMPDVSAPVALPVSAAVPPLDGATAIGTGTLPEPSSAQELDLADDEVREALAAEQRQNRELCEEI